MTTSRIVRLVVTGEKEWYSKEDFLAVCTGRILWEQLDDVIFPPEAQTHIWLKEHAEYAWGASTRIMWYHEASLAPDISIYIQDPFRAICDKNPPEDTSCIQFISGVQEVDKLSAEIAEEPYEKLKLLIEK